MNKKTVFISVLIILFVSLLTIMIHKENKTLPRIKTAEEEMPNFNFQLVNGKFIQRTDMDDTKYTLMCFFNTECDLCINETKALVDSIALLNNCQIVMVSHEDSVKIAEFNEKFGLNKFPSIHVACVPEDTVHNMFKIYVVPTLYVYHPDKRMLKYKPGPVTIQEIINFLK